MESFSYFRFEGSDHRPLVMYIDETRSHKKGTFGFDNRLREKEEIALLINDTWSNEDNTSVLTKINQCRRCAQNKNSSQIIYDTQMALEKSSHIELIGLLPSKLDLAYEEEKSFGGLTLVKFF